MKLDELRRMAERDSVVDDTALDIESLKIPQLHAVFRLGWPRPHKMHKAN